jgi:DNA processing protein
MLFPPSPRELLIALNTAPALSRPALCRLALALDRWSDAADPAGAADPALSSEVGVPVPSLLRALSRIPQAAAAAAEEEEQAARLGARLVTLRDPDYPPALLRLALPPPVLAVQGEIPEGPAVAVVGSRRADPYGLEAADLFARALAGAGVAIVSGFALGIDAAAHKAALAAGGKTVAVLGCGLGMDYPRGHRRLGRDIAENGARVSELPCGQAPRPWHFPVRNRMIAALAAGVLVVQATARSGSLITVRHALDLGRDVYAVPGRIFDESAIGPNSLIRDGALLAQHPRDILEALRVPPGAAGPAPEEEAEAGPPPPPGLPAEIAAALAAAGKTQPAEELAARLGRTVDEILGALLELELGGWVRRLPGGVYGRE